MKHLYWEVVPKSLVVDHPYAIARDYFDDGTCSDEPVFMDEMTKDQADAFADVLNALSRFNNLMEGNK